MGEADKVTAELKLSRELAETVAGVLQLPIRAAKRTPEALYAEQPAFLSGYLTGLADVMSQSAGGDPGGNLSQNLTLRLLIELFGKETAETKWSALIQYMDGDFSEFDQGMRIGGEDGNRIGNKRLPSGLGQHLGLKVPGASAP